MAISAEILKSYPAIDEAAVEALLQKEIAANHQKIVVLDDDPTGVQTVHDSSVYTTWDRDSIRQGFEEE
ncbi:MAG: four-carbon acid sugar kinase family protein, partial [Eubacterium aggregans]